MRKNAKLATATSFLVLGILSVLMLACGGPFAAVRPTETPTTIPFRSRVLSIPAGSTETVELAASAGDRIFGWFTVQGEKAEIDFSVLGPDGSQVVTKKRYTGRYDFQFPANAAGNYKLVFDNSFAQAEKGVLVSFKVSPATK